ncbi:recombinase family protein [Thiorhodococcus mannitoliphagus]|uniref:Recombinase family protein n=1 Tax=Thiorhodococcus mannitoliphagus TaxID=329406 RepID=A0A6P1E1H9_9GAMM|nr:recombinase family protein [Thiorhodococcus mannitoliphagus]NEX23650.1 recombinase family protein [Thiorhodococcus mannitoliphagus]
MGWSPEAIDIIDEDQGQSALSAVHRHGFQHLAAEVAAREVGIVLMLEASRLARCGSDWHRLIEICSITRTLIADELAVYDPREPNDRLLLGVKGTLSEAELMTLRTRLYEGRWNKARKGQLARSVPIGYVVDEQGQWAKDPDRQVQARIEYVFALFRRLGVARQVVRVLRDEQLTLPVRLWGGPGHGQLVWKEASAGIVMRLLRNPTYAGVYVYGEWAYDGLDRHPNTGKARPHVRAPEHWPVCLQAHHAGYLTWEAYLANRQRLRQNGFGMMTRGAPRDGAALLQGLVWCGRCGARMGVNTYSARERRKPSYICNRQYHEGAAHTCQSMSAQPIDEVAVALFLEAMAPAQIALSLQVVDDLRAEKHALQQQWEQQLQQARYAAQLAQRQYDAVDPDNRLVAATLERRWNEQLQALQDLEQAYQKAQAEAHFTLTEAEQCDIQRLAHDLPTVWQAPGTTDRERKQLLRFLIAEVQLDGVATAGMIDIRVTWCSGAVTTRRIARLKVGAGAPRTDAHVIARLRDLAPTHPVAQIVEILNAEGLRSAHGRVLREHHVLYLARRHHIEVTTSARLRPKTVKDSH